MKKISIMGAVALMLSNSMTSTFGHSLGPRGRQEKRVKFSRSDHKPHQGVAEIARRKLQIDNGMLKVSKLFIPNPSLQLEQELYSFD